MDLDWCIPLPQFASPGWSVPDREARKVGFPQTDRNRVRRAPERGHYDKATVYRILDAGFLCHVGFAVDQQPYVIPTLYGREADALYLHGSAGSRMVKTLALGGPVCLTVTHVDGLVLARSAVHHSMNYRSVVVFGTAVEVTGSEKERGLFLLSENVLRNRWDEVRAPSEKELRATSVLRLDIESASAKIRTGPPKDEPDDYDLPVWAGVIPVHQTYGPAQAEDNASGRIDIPRSVSDLLAPE